MDNSKNSFEIGETPSCIVRIAYRQLSIMTGSNDLADPTAANQNKEPKKEEEFMVCTRRLFRLPIFLSVTSSLCRAYTTVKGSHESVTSVFVNVEDALSKGAEYVSPVTNRIGETLETPLKSVDNVVCIGLDFLEKKVLTIDFSQNEIYDNISNTVRTIFRSIVPANFLELTNRPETSTDKDASRKKDDRSNNVKANIE